MGSAEICRAASKCTASAGVSSSVQHSGAASPHPLRVLGGEQHPRLHLLQEVNWLQEGEANTAQNFAPRVTRGGWLLLSPGLGLGPSWDLLGSSFLILPQTNDITSTSTQIGDPRSVASQTPLPAHLSRQPKGSVGPAP